MDDLLKQTQSLQDFFNQKSQHQNPQIVYQRLHMYMQLLTIRNSIVRVEIDITGLHCVLCQKKVTRDSFIRLECECRPPVCSVDCLRAYVVSLTGGQLYSYLYYTYCPSCRTYINPNQLLSSFTEWEIQSSMLQPTAVQEAPKPFICGIHGDESPASDLVVIPCGHKYCSDCIQTYLSTKLNDNGQATLSCPTKSCPESIPETEIRKLTPELFQKYQKLMLNSAIATFNSVTDTVFDCPTPDCPNRIIADKKLMDFTCNICKKRYCPQCKSPVHVPKTCKEYFDFLQAELKKHLDQLQMDEAATAAYFKANGIKPCPECKVPIHKISGCQYVTCLSGICQGKTYLCMNCGIKLPGDHAAHPCHPN